VTPGAPRQPSSLRRAPVARVRSSRLRRALVPLGIGLSALVLGGCQAPTFGAFRGATTQGKDEFKLWVGMVIAGLVVAVFVWGLIFWSIIRYRRRDDTIPRQFHQHIPLEVAYTLIPLIIVLVIFYFTVLTENNVDAVSTHPNETIAVQAYRWGWHFTYEDGSGRQQGVNIQTPALSLSLLPRSAKDTQLYPQLVLPANETVRINLTTADVIHGFYIPAFNFSRYAQSGVSNQFDFTPTELGIFTGQCTQFCGLYHADMLFSVKVVSPAQFQSWLSSTQASQASAAAA
jgi:cytochrome c oxidase subunit II